jgi:hypothetical protein
VDLEAKLYTVKYDDKSIEEKIQQKNVRHLGERARQHPLDTPPPSPSPPPSIAPSTPTSEPPAKPPAKRRRTKKVPESESDGEDSPKLSDGAEDSEDSEDSEEGEEGEEGEEEEEEEEEAGPRRCIVVPQPGGGPFHNKIGPSTF